MLLAAALGTPLGTAATATHSATRTGRRHGLGPASARADPARPIVAGERIHVVGAGGAGASAAALLAARGRRRRHGCDPGGPSPYTPALDAAGIAMADRHDPAHVTRTDRRRTGWP